MDEEEERKKKVEAGKAKLASFRKKKSSKKKKKSETASSTPRDGSHSEDIGAGDSIAVQTGDDNSVRALSPSDESDRSTTTAEDITTEEEGGYSLGLSPIERIQELELTVSDQQAALQKLTHENKALHDKNAAALAQRAIVERDSVIKELRDSVVQSAQHVRHLQQQLTKTTDAVIDTGGEQGQIVADLTETRQKLDLYQNAIVRQEEAMVQMARKLEEKSLEAGEAIDKCRSLQLELDKSQSQVASSEENMSGAMRTLQDELKREKDFRTQQEEQFQDEMSSLKRELERMKEQRQMDEQISSGGYDPEDLRAYREQVALMRSQLETAYRDIDKLKRDHDKEVIQLNQQLVSSVDEYETKLQEERAMAEELEQKLEMSDTVSSEIQASFSKQLEQLEEERDTLRQQLRQSQLRAKENSASKNQIKSLEEEVVSYQAELAEASERLEDSDKKRRHLRDEMERTQEALEKVNNERSKLRSDYDELAFNFGQQKEQCDELNKAIDENFHQMETIAAKHENELFELKARNSTLVKAAEEDAEKNAEVLKELNQEHTEELKNLHSQHHRQMDELRKEMEKQLDSTKCSLDEARKEQLETVKDVHERSRDREFVRLKEDHKDAIEKLAAAHRQEVEEVRTEEQELKKLAEERLRIELKEEFDATLEKELSIIRRSLEQENDLSQAEMEEKHQEELMKIKLDREESLKLNLQEELQEQQALHQQELLHQKQELDNALEAMKTQFEEAQEVMSTEHAQSLARMEAELEEIHSNEAARSSGTDDKLAKVEAELKEKIKVNDDLKQQMSKLHDALKSQIEQLETQHATSLSEVVEKYESEIQEKEEAENSLKEELLAVQAERDLIFSQAEESQKRLAALHHEESMRVQEELDQMEANYQEKVEQMQFEIESLRASRDDFQDLRSQLIARNASVEEMAKMREEFAEEKEKLIKEKEQLIEEHEAAEKKLREKHQEEVEEYEEKLEQLTSSLNESREKLEEAKSASAPTDSSPMRSISQMSDYDSSNVAALNKDYRSALTLTNVADVSGLSDTLEKVAESRDERSSQSDAESRSSSSSSSSSEDQQETSVAVEEDDGAELIKEVEALRKQLDETEAQLEKLKSDHHQVMEDLNQEHKKVLEELKDEANEDAAKVEESQKQTLSELQQSHDEIVKKLQESHQKETTQIRLQCASDTASQVEEECAAMREQLKAEFQSEMDSMKHQMEAESSEKLDMERQKHDEELQEQSDKLSSSMEVRIAAVMSELHGQKQEALQKSSSEHQEEMKRLRSEFDEKLREAALREEEVVEEWKTRKEELERDVKRLESDFQKSKEDYRRLTDDLDSGSNEYLKTLQAKHEDDLERLRKRLEEEHEERQESALKKQAIIFKQAQEDFVKLHEGQLEKFVSGQKEDAEMKEKEVDQRMDNLKKRLLQEHSEEKKILEETHNEEMKVVATKLVEVDAENQDLKVAKKHLVDEIEVLQADKIQELADMKTTLVNQHMVKFQEVTANLDQLHKEEMDRIVQQHQEDETRLKEDIASMRSKIEAMEDELKMREDMLSKEEVEEKMKTLKEEHEEEIKLLQRQTESDIEQLHVDHDAHLQQIEEEIQHQDEEHKESMEKMLTMQSGDLDKLQKQFDEALRKATEASLLESQKMEERVHELEDELQLVNELRGELEEVKERKSELDALLEEWKLRMEVSEEERNNEKEEHETKLAELSQALAACADEYKDLSSRMEFEKAEYEAEIESLKDDVRNKDENIKELEAETEHKCAALDSLVRQQEELAGRRDREAQEGDNLLKMLRDDLERINRERDSATAANEQLLSTLTELVRSNHRCEEMIAHKLENLPIQGRGERQPDADAQNDATNRDDTDSTTTPLNTSLSGSFVDEGLDLSQRLTESMFIGPELDPSARETVTGSGLRVWQAVERLMDMLENTIKQLNDSQQAQTELGDELLRVFSVKQDNNNNQQDDKEETERLMLRIAELEKQISEQEKDLVDAVARREEEIESKEEYIQENYAKLEDEKNLLKKQKEALLEGRDETELNLIHATEELTKEKQMLVERHQAERKRLEEAARQLEEVITRDSAATEERETCYLSQIDDLKSQIDALTKQAESGSRFAAEMTTDREAERDQFEQEMEAMRSEIDQARNAAKAEALLAEKVAVLEEELDTRQQTQEESDERIEKLKEDLLQSEKLVEELQQRLKDNENEDRDEDILKLKTSLDESRRQEEVLQKELYETMLRISALEAQLDRYRHGVDENALAALERAEAEERRMKEQGIQDLEAKEAEIEHLVEQQNALRTHLVEKEEEVERLLHSMEKVQELEAENVKLKEGLETAEVELSDARIAPSQSQQMEALSRHLLEDKNAEIDDLRQKVALLQSDDVEGESQEMLSAMQLQVRELTSENEELRQQLHETGQRLDAALQEQLLDEAPHQQEAVYKDASHTDEDTGIQDLTTGDLTRREDSNRFEEENARLRFLEEENVRLHRELEESLKQTEDLLSQLGKDVFRLPPGTKEKIRDLEEWLEKEKEDSSSKSSSSESSSSESSSSESSSDDEDTKSEKRIISDTLVLTHPDSTKPKKEKLSRSKDSNVIQDKLEEIEEEIKTHPYTVLGRLLRNKDEIITSQAGVAQHLEAELNEKENEVAKLEKQVADAHRELNEPDLKIRMLDGECGAVKMEEMQLPREKYVLLHEEEELQEERLSEDADEMVQGFDSGAVEELKMLLGTKEQEIERHKDLIKEKDQLIQENKNNLVELRSQIQSYEEKIAELEAELNENSKQIEELRSNAADPAPSDLHHQEDVIQLKEELSSMTKKVASAQEERIRMSKQLDDIQRECSSLLEDNQLLEEEKRTLEEEVEDGKGKMKEQEEILQGKLADTQKLEAESTALKQELVSMSEQVDKMKERLEEVEQARNALQLELRKLSVGQDAAPTQSTASKITNDGVGRPIGASGDALAQRRSSHGSLSPPPAELESAEVMRLEKIDELKEEIDNLTFKNEELEAELETLKQSHVDECESLMQRHEKEITHLEDQLNEIHESTRMEDAPQDAPSLHLTRIPSTDSKSLVEGLEDEIEELKKKHQLHMEEVKKNYARELEEAVARATKEQEERAAMRLSEIEEKHRKEMTEMLSESMTGDSELAQRLRNELDLADKLDKELIDQLTSVTQQNGQPIESEQVSLSHASPGREAEISTHLQHLLSRLHNEGVQVLSLSELQFLKQHQPNRNVSINTDEEGDATPQQSAVDVDALKLAWESEKLALLDAIQALKELLTQTATDAAQFADEDEGLKWRGDLLRAVADLFEREKRALLAELRANVIEAHGEAERDDELDAASRLESLERKIRNQELQHRSELERLLAADRDQLVEDLKQVRAEKKEMMEKAQSRLQQQQGLHKMAEESSRKTINQLQSQLDCVTSKLQQEEALTSDLMASLETEKQRAHTLLPSLQKERDRTLELTKEVASMSEDCRREVAAADHQIEQMRSEIDSLAKTLEESEEKINFLQRENEQKREEVINEREKQEQDEKEHEEEIAHLHAALSTEEKRRQEAVTAVEVERHNVRGLHQELASERASSYQEVVQLKNRCDDLTAAIQAEKGRCAELQGALEREATLTRHARMELENERKMTSEAREHDRATVADLQAILEDAKKETERVQKRVEVAEQEREEAIQRAEEEQVSSNRKLAEERTLRDEAMANERRARTELQTALESEKLRKLDAQRRIRDLEERQKVMLQQQNSTPPPREAQDVLLARRRQLESLRQRLQLEASKLQNLIDRTAHRTSPRDQSRDNASVSPSSSLLSSDGEKFESLKRALQDMQGELKELYSGLSLPDQSGHVNGLDPMEFNDRLLKQNAELSNHAAEAAREARELRDAIADLQEEQRRIRREEGPQSPSLTNQQKMAARMQKLYTRYLRAESFRKSLVYQKKYLLLLLGGFQDCEEATLALIARMGAYPSNDALQRTVTHRSAAFTRFRSAARVVIAVCRLKFLVRKWHRANNTVSAAIENKHGIRVPSTSGVNGGPSLPHSTSRTPSPRVDAYVSPSSFAAHRDEPVTSHYPYSRYSMERPSRDTSPYTGHNRPSTSPYSSSVPQPHSYELDRSYGSYNGDHSAYSPAVSRPYAGLDRGTHPSDTDPSLNEYIQKLENIQHKLKYPR